MTVRTIAHSISRAVQEQLLCSQASHLEAHVLAVFEHACDLVTHAGDVVALVTSHAGNGPLNIVVDDSVVDGPAGLFAGLEPGEPVTLEGECLWVGGLRVDLGRAVVWEPRPDWDALRARRDVILSSLPFLRDLCLCMAPAGSLLTGAGYGRRPGFSREVPTEVGRPSHSGSLLAGSGDGRTPGISREVPTEVGRPSHSGSLLAGTGDGRTPGISREVPTEVGRPSHSGNLLTGAGYGRRPGFSREIPTEVGRPSHSGNLLAGSGDGRTSGISREIPTEVGRPSLVGATLAAVWRAAEALREGWGGRVERLHEGALGLAGLGSGLTPAGDDFLTGTLLWAWLAHPVPAPFCRALVEAAIPRTTVLSAAFLRAAARGECSASWHGLLEALGEGVGDRVPAPPVHGGARIASQHRLFTAVQELMAHGATSGADSLAGFLYASEF